MIGAPALARSVLDALTVAVIVTDADGLVVEWNAGAEVLYGYRRDEALGRPVLDLTVAAESTEVAADIMAALADHRTWEGDFLVRRNDGTTFHAHVRDVPLHDAHGNFAGVLGISFATHADQTTRIDHLERLRRLTDSLARALTPAEVGDIVLSTGLEGIGSESGSLFLLDRERDELVAVKLTDVTPEVEGTFGRVSLDDALPICAVARTGDADWCETRDEIAARWPLVLEVRPNLRAYAAVPLVVDGVVIGAMGVSFPTPRHFTPDGREFLLGVGVRCAQALQRSLLHQRVADALRDSATALARLDTLLASAPVGVGFVDRDLRFQQVNEALAAMNGRPVEELIGARLQDLDSTMAATAVGFIRRVLETGEPIIGAELDAAMAHRAGHRYRISWFPVAPAGGDAIDGVGFVVDDVTERRAAEERLRAESQIVETLHHVGSTLAAELDPAAVVRDVTEAATLVTGARAGAFVHRLQGEPACFVHGALDGWDAEVLRGLAAPPGVVRVDEMGETTADAPVVAAARSWLAVPVVSGRGEAIGVLHVAHVDPGAFDERDERLVVGIAGQAAVALDNARLYQAERDARAAAERAQRRLAVLAEAGRWLLSSLDVDQALAGLCRAVVPRVADACVIDVVGDDGSVRRVSSGDGDGDGSSASAPLQGRSDTYGTITFVVRPPRTIEPDDEPLLQELAARAGVAVENARLFTRHRDAALTLQRSLLPERFPSVPGLSFASRYLPGGAGLEVGGDLYDVLQLPGGDVGLVLGDVVGRGIEAAALMGQLRNGLRAYALDDHAPGDALARLDHLVQATTRVPLVTLLYGRLDPSTGALRLANAGHPPPLVVGPDGSARFLDPAVAPPIGVVAGASFPEVRFAVEPGSVLVLYSDGLVEQRDVDLASGMATLLDAARTTPLDDLEAFCDALVGAALGDVAAHDDVALLAVRRDQV